MWIRVLSAALHDYPRAPQIDHIFPRSVLRDEDFDVVYYVKTGDYTKYLDIQQRINFEILEEFEKEKIEMPYPTQKIFYINEREAA